MATASSETFLRKGALIGRKAELRHLRDLLHQRGESHAVYYYAQGGYGKTRLLEELQVMVAELGETFRTTGIIDLYHTDTHSASDVERAIVEGLDADRRYFKQYRSKRTDYELLRERGADPGLLESKREELGQVFVKEWGDLALDSKKLVICLDTVELLQYESSVVEDTVGAHTIDTRIRAWLLDKLPQLKNVLVVFAGRPKPRSSDERINHQERLISDMHKAFDDRFEHPFEARELPPLDMAETEALVEMLTRQIAKRTDQSVLDGKQAATIVPAEYLALVYRLTAGRPIYIHLIVDLLGGLSPEPGRIFEMLDRHMDLVAASEDDQRIGEARREIEAQILDAVYNHSGELGGYISRIALMPKGADAEIFSSSLGLTKEEAQAKLDQLASLSFVKQYAALRGGQTLHAERLFLHDEMHQLVMAIPYRRMNERHVAQGVITNYYDPQIETLQERIEQLIKDKDDADAPRDRVLLRERLQKLQVERLYYQMVRDPRQAYQEYKRLSDQANRYRWVGFGMRLLDEFLRFYNDLERREQFEKSGIVHEQVIRESTELWAERFYWWGQKRRCVDLAEQVMSEPAKFGIREQDVSILGNICARWADAKADLSGYDPTVVTRAEAYLARIGDDPATPEAMLAFARLHTSIGYQLRKGGQLRRAAEHYVAGNTAYRRLASYRDELAILLNNLAYAYARQGRFHLARPLASEALRINESMANDYTTGLTLSTFAAIEAMRGNFDDAIRYGQDARERFQRMEDPHGIVLSYLSLARAERKMAKGNIDMKRKLEDARSRLETAKGYLQRALEETERGGLTDDRGTVYAELGRVLREMGKVTSLTGSPQEAEDFYQDSQHKLMLALEGDLAKVDRADVQQDLAELQAVQGAYQRAGDSLKEVEATVGAAYLIEPDRPAPKAMLPSEYFLPLGKAARLRGKMSFEQGQNEQALQQFVVAYAYFHRFSADTPEKDQMIDLVYDKLTGLDVQLQRNLVTQTREWAEHQDFRDDVKGFTDTLRDLTGI